MILAQASASPASAAVLDRARFDDLARAAYQIVFRFAQKLTGCVSTAEDLTQETFLRAYRARETYDTRRPFKQWVQRITYRLFLDRLRARKAPEMVSLDALTEGEGGRPGRGVEIPDCRHEPERLLLARTLEEPLESALRALPDHFREAIVLCDVQQLSYEEIANQMGCTPGTIRSRIHRGRKVLHQILTTGKQPWRRNKNSGQTTVDSGRKESVAKADVGFGPTVNGAG